MEEINYLKQNSFIQEVISLIISDKASEIIKKNDGNGLLDIELKINGVELSFINSIKEIEKWYDELVDIKARKIIQEKIDSSFLTLSQISSIADDLKFELEEKMESLLNK